MLAAAIGVGVLCGLASAGLVATVHAGLQAMGGGPRPDLLWTFVALCVLNPLARLVSEYLLLSLGQRTLQELRLELTERILGTPLARLEQLGSHRLLASLTDDVNALGQAVVLLPNSTVLVAITVGCLLYLAWLSPLLFAVLLGVMAAGMVSYQLPMLAGERRFAAAREGQDRLFGYFRSLTEGLQELKLTHRRAVAFRERVRDSASELASANVAAFTIFNVATNWGHVLFFVVLGVLVFGLSSLSPAGAPLWLEDRSEAVLTGYALTLLYLMSPLHGLLGSLATFSRARVALAKIETLGLALKAGLESSEVPSAPSGWSRLELCGLAYSYDDSEGQPGFEVGPLNLCFEPGQLIFVVGGNGSGKTTFSKLITGLYTPRQGELRLDGEVIDDATRPGYSQRFAAVFSSPFVFDELLGIDPEEADRESRPYLDALGLAHKVRVQGGRFSTTALSQGQKKRLALLTAYLENRELYLFDEWAADQDPTFRAVFYRRILPELKARGKTVFVISHDDRYYETADRILVFELGQVSFDGSFADYGHGELGERFVFNREARSTHAF